MNAFSEADLQAVTRIQEIKSCTVAQAKDFFRKAVAKLANPDVEDRGAIVLENLERQLTEATDKKAAKSAAKPAAKKKAVAKKKAASKPREPKAPLPELVKDVELKEAEGTRHTYTANLFGRKHAVTFIEAERKNAGDTSPMHYSEDRIAEVKKYAKDNELPVAFCVAIYHKGKAEQGYAVSEETFKKFSSKMSRGRVALSLSVEARKTFEWDGCKFAVTKLEAKAA